MPVQTEPFDASEFLTSAESQVELLADAFESGDAGYVARSLGVIAKALGLKIKAVSAEAA